MSGQADSGELHASMQAERSIRRICEEWVDALIRGDVATLNRIMDEDCIFTFALEGEDRAQFLSEIQSGDLRVDSLQRDNVEVRVYGATGVLTALDTSDWLYKGRRIQAHYKVMQVYSLRDGDWKLVAIQASPIA